MPRPANPFNPIASLSARGAFTISRASDQLEMKYGQKYVEAVLVEAWSGLVDACGPREGNTYKATARDLAEGPGQAQSEPCVTRQNTVHLYT